MTSPFLLDLARRSFGQIPTWAEILAPGGLLLRDFIFQSLYHPSAGYFTRTPHVVGQLPSPLPYKSFYTKGRYDRYVRRAYDQLKVSWLTPSELFFPFYGHSIARFLLTRHLNRLPDPASSWLHIYEIGAGGGAVARSVLDYLLHQNPQVHARTLYRTVEISPGLAERQRARVLEDEPAHRGHFEVEVRDASDEGGWRESARAGDPPPAILGFEVLDNLPHDRVLQSASGQWFETWVDLTPSGSLQERTRPLSDSLLSEACAALGLDSTARPTPASEPVFVPTTAFQLFKSIRRACPSHTLLLGDFDALPGVQIRGRNAPLVSATVNGLARDFGSYLVAPGSADIFFPTDFAALTKLYHAAGESTAECEHVKNSEFQRVYRSPARETRTALGLFDPLVEDFANTSFLVAVDRRC